MRKPFLDSPAARWLTPVILVLLTACQYVLIVHAWPSWWVVLVLGTVIQHRLGILCHELIHGLAFHERRWNRAALMLWDGLLLAGGALEVFRAQHLQHHRFVNTERDPAFRTLQSTGSTGWWRYVRKLEIVDQVAHTWAVVSGRSDLRVSRRAMAVGLTLTVVNASLWIMAGLGHVPLMLVATTLLAAGIPSSMRGAVEHFGPAGTVTSTNEYRALIFNFHMERHRHHHAAPGVPWYKLRFLSEEPLPAWAPLYYWFKVHVTRQYEMLPPPKRASSSRS